MIHRLALIVSLAFLLGSCGSNKGSFTVSELSLLSNVPSGDSVVKLSLDLTDAVLNGIEIPTRRQVKEGYFKFSFKISNNSDDLKRYLYKIYYQNETYKFDETNPLSEENFYGSWEEKSFTFKPTRLLTAGETAEVTDSFRIIGNPRNEKQFFGCDLNTFVVNDEKIREMVNRIKSVPDWAAQIRKKCVANKISEEEQFYRDALWSINNDRQQDSSSNNRWKRNPRVGKYQFMVVVTTLEEYQKIPEEVKDISRKNKDGTFTNPFAYFKKYADASPEMLVAIPSKKLLVDARLDFSKGIYIDLLSVNKANFVKDYYSQSCNDSTENYRRSQIELFFHNINKDYVVHNIPEIRDVVGEGVTRAEYRDYLKKYTNSPALVNTYVNSTDCPCKNVTVDTQEGSITLRNPGNEPGKYNKEHVGIVTRIGFTYGKFRAKIKFPEMLSKDNVWNGITNAFWMIAQDGNATWNMRRPCNADVAYIPKQEPDNESALQHSKKQITYSEIDFEIVKESEFWPLTSYKNSNVPFKKDSAADSHDIMVTCTNWDMACHEPKNFSIGAKEFTIDGKKELLHRWDHFYKALTTKVPVEHDEIFKRPYYYFEIEWLPDKIIWRIGPEKDKMRIICVMDKDISAIPSNQMLMVITQEWHNQEWWPTAPFGQNFIPFPKNDIIGKVLEIEIE